MATLASGLLGGTQGPLPPDHPPLPTQSQAAFAATPAEVPLPAGHPQVTEGKAPPTAEELLAQLDATPGLLERDKPFEMAAMIGRLYLYNGRPKDAQAFFAQASEKAGTLRELFLTERRRLSVSQRAASKAQPCALPEDAVLEAREREARARLSTGDRVVAVACARVALAPVLEVMSQHGHAAFLAGDAPAALAAHARVLELDSAHEESLFARSALLYETRGTERKALVEAQDGFRRLLKHHPQGSRAALARELLHATQEALAAGGVPQRVARLEAERKERLVKEFPTMAPASDAAPPAAGPPAGGLPSQGSASAQEDASASAPALSPEVMQAMQNVERTPELEARLDEALAQGEEHLAQGRFDAALASYRQVMPFRPDGRTQAGLAWALVGLGKPTAERVWGVAVKSAPDAVDALGDTLLKKGDAEGAKALWGRLATSAPDYARTSGLQRKLE